MIGATSIGHGNSRGIASFGIRGSGSSVPGYRGSTRGMRLNSSDPPRSSTGSARGVACRPPMRNDSSVSPSVNRWPGITRTRWTQPAVDERCRSRS